MRMSLKQIFPSMQKTCGNNVPVVVQGQLAESKNGSRGQRHNPLLHVIELMLPTLSTLRAQAYCAPASAKCRLILAALLTLNAMTTPVVTAEEAVIGNVLGEQDFPALSIHPFGGYLVFEDNRTASGRDGRGITAVALDSDLQAHGESFRVNQLSLGKNEKPQVLTLSNGNTLFAWEIRQGAKAGIYSRTVDSSGKFLTSDLLINAPTLQAIVKQTARWFGYSRNSGKLRTYKFKDAIQNVREQAGNVVMAALPDGGAALAYHAMRKSETNTWQLVRDVKWTGSKFTTNDVLTPVRYSGDWKQDIFIQRLDSAGKKVGSETLVNQYTDNNQRTPSLTVLPNGNIVVTWVCEFPVSTDWKANFRIDLIGRLFNPLGDPVTDEFPVAMGDDLMQANPVVSGLAGGGFSVFWSQQEGEASRRWDVYGRVFGADASASGPAFRVNAFTMGDQFAPRVASFVESQLVVWTSTGQDGSGEGVYGRVLNSGVLSGEEFRVNTTTIGRQLHPAVSADAQGRALVVWSAFVGGTAGDWRGMDLFGSQLSIGPGEPGTSNP